MVSAKIGIAFADWTDRAVGQNVPRPSLSDNKTRNVSQVDFVGCHLNASREDASNQIALSRTTGNALLDAGMSREYDVLCAQLAVRPGLFMFDDPSPNAFATPEIIGDHPFPDGTVCFGSNLMISEFRYHKSQGGRFDHVMAAIMAHEWAHIMQFKALSEFHPGKQIELQADQMAGWYMGVRALQTYGAVDLRSALIGFFRKGDYHFNDSGHHGTPEDRGMAFQRGLMSAQIGLDLTQAFRRAASECGVST